MILLKCRFSLMFSAPLHPSPFFLAKAETLLCEHTTMGSAAVPHAWRCCAVLIIYSWVMIFASQETICEGLILKLLPSMQFSVWWAEPRVGILHYSLCTAVRRQRALAWLRRALVELKKVLFSLLRLMLVPASSCWEQFDEDHRVRADVLVKWSR